jgi:hypothetical protein
MKLQLAVLGSFDHLHVERIEAVDAQRLDDGLLRTEARSEVLLGRILSLAVRDLARVEQLTREFLGALEALPQPLGLHEIDTNEGRGHLRIMEEAVEKSDLSVGFYGRLS